MSRIRWRAWDSDKGEYFKPTYEAYRNRLEELLLMPCGDLCIRTMDGTAHESTFENRFIVEQFTGLEDKNGRGIFEGDILDCVDRIVKVEYNEPNATFDSIFLSYTGKPICSNGVHNAEWKYRAEVIGNVHTKRSDSDD